MLEKLLKLLGENGQWSDEELEVVRGILCLAGLILGFFFMGIAGENPDKTVDDFTFTFDKMMNFFDWKCAYSGEKLKKDTRTLDHIISLKQGGDHEIWNLVPMTRSLNSSKQEKDMLEWYKEQDCYSEARLAKIYEWQEYARRKWKK